MLVAQQKLMVLPAIDEKAVQKDKLYRIGMPAGLYWRFAERSKNLRDVEPGPSWRSAELWEAGR